MFLRVDDDVDHLLKKNDPNIEKIIAWRKSRVKPEEIQ